MKVLVVSPFLPYAGAPHAGGVSVYESIKRLSSENEVTLLARADPSEIKEVEALKGLLDGLHLYPFRYDSHPVFKVLSYIILGLKANRLIREGSFDMVQVEFTETAVAFKRPSVPSVLVAHDVITKPALRRLEAAAASGGIISRVISTLKYKSLAALERRVSKKFDRVFTMSEVDKEFLESMDPGISAVTSTNLLGLSFSSDDGADEADVADGDGASEGEEGGVEREELSILFAGAMNRGVNVEAALYFYEEVFPLVRKDLPEALFYVVGSGPPERLLRAAEADPSLVVTGFVDDLDEYFKRATVFVSPILVGGGIIVKNIQAMALGLPLVTTSRGNEAIGAEHGTETFVADDPEAMAQSVSRLLRDPALRVEMAGKARSLARGFSDEILFEKRLALYRELLEEVKAS